MASGVAPERQGHASEVSSNPSSSYAGLSGGRQRFGTASALMCLACEMNLVDSLVQKLKRPKQGRVWSLT